MFQQFINRQEEFKALEERFKSGKPEFVVVYGRRRVGKTELAAHFLGAGSKRGIYFLSEEKRYEDNLNEMREIRWELPCWAQYFCPCSLYRLFS